MRAIAARGATRTGTRAGARAGRVANAEATRVGTGSPDTKSGAVVIVVVGMKTEL